MHEQLVQKFYQKAFQYPKEDQERILSAAVYADSLHGDQKRKSGEPYIIHPLAVGSILIQLGMDADTICAGLLHDVVEDTDATLADIEERFGPSVALMVDGVTKISRLKSESKSLQEAETIRKMFFAMGKDIGNLGISWMKTELEDLSLKTLKPDTYQYISDFLLSKKGEYNAYIKNVQKTILMECAKAGMTNISVKGRVKHVYSVYLKIKRRKKEIDEIFDVLGVRVICDTVGECYNILGIIHQTWPPIEGRFKDYIAMPKKTNSK